MACNSCHNHSGGMSEDLFKHTSIASSPLMPNPTKKPIPFLLIGGLILGAVILSKWSKT